MTSSDHKRVRYQFHLFKERLTPASFRVTLRRGWGHRDFQEIFGYVPLSAHQKGPFIKGSAKVTVKNDYSMPVFEDFLALGLLLEAMDGLIAVWTRGNQ